MIDESVGNRDVGGLPLLTVIAARGPSGRNLSAGANLRLLRQRRPRRGMPPAVIARDAIHSHTDSPLVGADSQ